MITIYTDGASRGNPGPGGWGAIIINTVRVAELGGREEHTTNNRMELVAAIKALGFAGKLDDTPMEVHTDSEYVMKGMTSWITGWQKRNWRTTSKKPVLNQELWQELLAVTEGKDIAWKYVAGHSGVPLNERADVIATTFADNMKIDLYDGPREKYKFA